MIQPARRDFVFANRERFASCYLLKFSLRAHRRHVHWKIRHRHLRFEDLLQAVAPQKFRAETVEMKSVVFHVEGGEKRYALDVIPVVVSDQDVRSRAASRAGRSPAVPQHA